jgi:hypothetical protein
MAAVVLPEQVDDPGVDLRVYYERHHRWFFGFLVATLVVSLLKDLIISGGLPGPLNLAFHLVLGAASISALVIRERRLHEVVGVVGAVGMAAYIGLLFTRLR